MAAGAGGIVSQPPDNQLDQEAQAALAKTKLEFLTADHARSAGCVPGGRGRVFPGARLPGATAGGYRQEHRHDGDAGAQRG
jgi:hypothetical protein